jgi:hypothetical protein
MAPGDAEEQRRSTLIALLLSDPCRMRLLGIVEGLRLPDSWIGAGFVRTAVWDHLHSRAPSAPAGDVDVVWFDRTSRSADDDRAIEDALAAREPSARWSVKNQARMHARNGDPPYASTEDALRHWPETATAVAVRSAAGALDILAPCGLGDLFAMIVRPTAAFTGDRLAVVQERVRSKLWLERWPLVRLAGSCEKQA